MITYKQKALIHVAKNRVGMNEAEYRALLESVGAASSRDLTHAGFEAVMRHFELLGFVSTGKYRRPPQSSKKRLASKIQAIRAELNLPEAYIDAMCQRMFKNADGEPICSWRWLSADQLHRLVAALTYHQRRQGKAR